MEHTVTAKYDGLYPDDKLESRMDALVGKKHGNHGCYIQDRVRDVDWFFPTRSEAFLAANALNSVGELIDVVLGHVEEGCLLEKFPPGTSNFRRLF